MDMTPQSGPLELENVEPISVSRTEPDGEAGVEALAASASKLARNLAWAPGQQESSQFRDRCEVLSRILRPLLGKLESRSVKSGSDDFLRLQEHVFLLEGELQETCTTFHAAHKLPQVRTPGGAIIPRIAALAGDFLAATSFQFTEAKFAAYIQAFQQVTVLRLAELWMLVPVMKLVLLEQITERGRRLLQNPAASYGVQDQIRSVQEIKQASWKSVIEPLILFDQILREDPAGAYARMDYESREQYRKSLVKIA
ncbi:MAG: hypothetical protein WCC95_03215, partial [Candidatus Sulfotelmatobacter sp.]